MVSKELCYRAVTSINKDIGDLQRWMEALLDIVANTSDDNHQERQRIFKLLNRIQEHVTTALRV